MKTKTMKITGILLSVVMLVAMVGAFSLTASAATEIVGAFSVDTDVTNGYTYSGGVLTISESGAYCISMAASEGQTSDRIVIKATGVTLTLDSVNIKAPDGESALTVEQNTSLILVGESTLIGSDAYFRNIGGSFGNIPQRAEYGIYGGNNQITISGDGTLTAISGENFINNDNLQVGYAVKDCTVILSDGTLKVKGGSIPDERDLLRPATDNVGIRAADGKILEITDTEEYRYNTDLLSQATYTAVPCTICAGNNDDELTYTYTVLETGHVARYACCNRVVVSEEPVDHDYDNAEHTCVCGVPLPHSYVYEANEEENTITETCAHGCNHNRLITLKAPENLVYNGTAKEATVDGTIIGNYEITYDSAPVNVGTYTAYITVGDATVSVDFTIKKAALTVKANNYTISYGDEPTNNGVTYTGFVNGENENVLTGELTYSYTYVQNGDVGDYTITPAGLTSDNYDINFESGTLTVAKKLIDSVEGLVVTLDHESFVYNGAEKKPNVTSITLNDQLIDAAYYDVSYNNNVYVGDDAEVIITFKGNYDGEMIQVFKITPKPILDSDISIDITEATYNGNTHTPTITVKDGEKTLVLDTDYTIVWDKDGFVNAGTYTATIKGKGNYSGSFTRTLVINKADLVIELTSPIPSVLPGNQIALTLNTNSDATPVWTITGGEHVSGTIIKIDDGLVIGQDKVTITVTYDDPNNIKGGSKTITLDVGMADFSGSIANLEADIDVLNELIADKADADEIEQKLTEITNRLQALEDVKEAYIAADATLKSELEEKLSAAKNELTDSINELNDRINEEVKKLQDQIDANDTDIADIKESLTAINGLIDALKAADVTLDGKITEAVEKAENELTAAYEKAIENAVEALNKTIADGDKVNADALAKAIEDLTALIEAAEKAAVDADAALKAALEGAIADAKNELTAAYEKAIENAVEALNKTIADGDKVNADALAKAIEDLTALIEAAENAAVDADASLKTALEGAIADAKNELTVAYEKAIENAVEALNKTIADGDKVNADALAKAIEDLTALIEAAENAAVDADAALKAALEGAIADAKNELTVAYEKAIENAVEALNKTIADGDKVNADALAKAIEDLTALIEAAEKAAVDADAALKTALEGAIADAKNELTVAYEKAIENAVEALNKTIADGDKVNADALAKAIEDLTALIEAAEKAAVDADAANKSELEGKITEAQTTLQSAIDKVAKDLEDAKTALEKAISDGNSALSDRISALSTALDNAISAYQAADGSHKSELTTQIEAADATLDAAIKAVQKNLDDAKAELNKAISDGDTELDGKITALNEALSTAKAALEAADTANKSELTTKIDEAYASLDAAIKAVQKNLDDLKAALEAKDNELANKDAELENKDSELQTFIIIVCVISGVTFCGCGTLAAFYIIDKKKKTNG